MTTETGIIELEAEVTEDQAGLRLDQAAASIWPDFSRSRLTGMIKAGQLTLNGEVVKPNRRLEGGEHLYLSAILEPHRAQDEPEPIDLDVLYADNDVLVINKPAGLVVHPGSGNANGTLVNALLNYDASLAPLPRAGLIHRLDKDTSGCLIVARTGRAHRRLVEMLKQRDIHRHYQALVWGRMIAGDTVDAPLGRHPVDRRRQVVRADGRDAVTHYRIHQHLTSSTWLDIKLETGRTHQIRVHMAYAGFPLIGDPVYGRRGSPSGLTEAQREAWRAFPRQALHALRIEFRHPLEDRIIKAETPLPDDFHRLTEILAVKSDV
ncbi:MAG: RluA family pseudouridine synthase [Pseudomonadota bacterium]